MRIRALIPACALLVSLDATTSAAPGDAGSDPVVVRVGSAEVRQSELGFLLGRLHEFERQSFGKTPAEIRRGFVEKRLVPELLQAEEGRARHSDQKPAVTAKIRAALGLALKEELERTFDSKLTRSELEAYCKSEAADASSGECSRDLSGYRVVLRRQRASDEMTRLSKELRERDAKGVDYALLDRLVVRSEGPSAATSSDKGQTQP